MWVHRLCEHLSAVSPTLLSALLDTTLKGIAILSLTGVVALVMRRASAAARHLIWFLGIVGVLMLPILSAVLPGWHILPPWALGSVSPQTQAPFTSEPASPLTAHPDTQLLPSDAPPRTEAPISAPAASIAPSISAPTSLRLTWQAMVLLGCLTGSALYLCYMALGFISLWRLQRQSSPITSGGWPILLRELCRQLNFRRSVELISSPHRAMPMTWGLWRTRLLLPEASTHWTPELRRAVLMHELAHAVRCDCLTQFVVQIACAVYWFNPLVWLAWRRMQAEREQACDDLVLRAGARASAYAEQLLYIASEMPAVAFSAAAIAMARPSKLEGRLRAILDTSRNRRRLASRTVVLITLAVGICALALAALRADDTPISPALQAVRRWADHYGWKAQLITPTTLETKTGWREIPFILSKDEQADARACIEVAGKSRSTVNGKTKFSDPAARAALEDILKRRPNYFYAEFLLAHWHRDHGDSEGAARLLDAAYQHAPVIIVQRFELPDGSPLADTPIISFALECNSVTKGYLSNLELPYFDLRTDADGCIYLPVYNTVYRTDDMSWPAGYDATFPTLGWFETSRKVALLPVATVTPKPGDFVPTGSTTQPSTAVVKLPGDNAVELLAISPYPDPQNVWWLPDGSPSTRQYQTGEPGARPWPAENGRRFVFRFAKALEPDAHLQFRFSAPTEGQIHYTTVRTQDLHKPYVLFTHFPTHPKSVTMRLGQTSGPWKPLAQYDPRTARTTGNLPQGFAFQEAKGKEDSVCELVVVHPVTDLELRLVAIDSDRKEHASSLSWFSRTEAIIEDAFRFDHLPLAMIDSFHLEAREYRWAQFGNIALSSGAADVPASQPTTAVPAARTTQAAADTSAWRAKLPCGATVELAAVTENSTSDKPFWRPDGSPLAHPPEHYPDRAKRPMLDRPGNDFMLLVSGLAWSGRQQGDYEVITRIQPDADAGDGVNSITWRDSILPPRDFPDGPKYSDIYVFSRSFPKSANGASIEFGLAAGPWETIASDPITGSGESMELRGVRGTNLDVSFGRPFTAPLFEDKPPTVHITVAHNVASDRQVRVVALLADGSETGGANPEVSNGHVRQITQAMRRGGGAGEQDMVGIKDVKEFRLQSRPFQWAVFPNIALSPAASTVPSSQDVATTQRAAARRRP